MVTFFLLHNSKDDGDTCISWMLTRARVGSRCANKSHYSSSPFMSNTSGSPLVALSIHSTTYPVFPSCLFFFFFLPNPFLLLSLSSSLTIMASSAASILQRQYKGMTLLQPISWYVSNSALSSISRAYTTPRSGLCSGSQEWQHFRMVPILYFTGPWDAKQYTRDVAIIGSPKTIYEGGYFKVRDGCID